VLTGLFIALAYQGEFARGDRLEAEVPAVRAHTMLMVRALLATVIMMALFLAGQPPAKAAIILGACCC
jgi:hypothetical protein